MPRASAKSATLPKDPATKIIDTAMTLAVSRPWLSITMEEIAEEAGLPLHEVYRYYESRADILAGLARMADATVLAEGTEDLEGETTRDALFDLLMRRFDALSPYKEALTRIAEGTRRNPAIAAALAPQLGRSMGIMLEAAGVSVSGPQGSLRVLMLTAAWVQSVRTWLDDDSADNAKTMAVLDKQLERLETLANSANQGPFGMLRKRRKSASGDEAAPTTEPNGSGEH